MHRSSFCLLALLIVVVWVLNPAVANAQPLLTPAQAAALQPLESWPESGTFWSLQRYGTWPPIPFQPFPTLDTFQLPDGSFVYDDSQVDYPALEEQREIDRAMRILEVQYGLDTANTSSPPLPGPGGSSGDPEPGPHPNNYKDYPTNSLWLEILSVSNNSANLLLHGTVPDVAYDLWTKQALTDSVWVAETWVPGAPETNVTPATIPVDSRTNALFIWARSCGDGDGNSLPDWWELQYFGINGVDPYVDQDGDGWLNIAEYQNGSDPTSFDTPPAPTGLSVRYNGSPTHVTATWNPSQGPVVRYAIERFIPEWQMVDYFTNAPGNEVVDDDPFPLAEPSLGYYPPTYRVRAEYPGGSSDWSPPVGLYAYDYAAQVVRGPEGRIFAVVSSLPNGTAALRLVRGDSALATVDVSLSQFHNGIYEIPEEVAGYFGSVQSWHILALHTNGLVFSHLGLGVLNSIPFIDGRQQLKENLSFLFRAANSVGPFQFGWSGYNFNNLFTCPETYAYSGFSHLGPLSQDFAPFGPRELWPFSINALYRNFVFATTNDLTPDGDLNTGAYFDLWPRLEYPSAYMPPTPTNLAQIPSLLPAQQPQWILSTEEASALDISVDSSGTNYSLLSAARNIYGLPYASATLAWGSPLGIRTIYPGGTGSAQSSPVLYAQVAEPDLATVDYYFTKLTPDSSATRAITPLPGEPSFASNTTTPLLITSVGDPWFHLAGYAKQVLLNGNTGTYGYLGQYFDKAFRVNPDGTRSTNETGILSEYGEFFATEPGPAILTTKPDHTQTNNLQGECTVHAIKLQLDVNHDGVMDLSFAGPDNTSPACPFVFWVNNDCDWATRNLWGSPTEVGKDVSVYGGEISPNYDYRDIAIRSQRDLEDYARVWLCGMPALPANQGYELTLSLANASTSTFAVNLVNSVESNVGTGYLTDPNVAAAQVAYTNHTSPGYKFARLTTSQSYTFPDNYFTNNATKHFLFEGAGIGSGQLVLTVSQATAQGTNVIAQTGVWLDLPNVGGMYERVVITNNNNGAVTNPASSIQIVEYPEISDPGPTQEIILYVHGASNSDDSWLSRSDTIFKRLYWSGYHGGFASVRWPSLFKLKLSGFDLSELYAYKSAAAVSAYANHLRTRFPGSRLHVFAHSQGGASASEAASLGAPVDTLILSQVAMPASCYDVQAPTNTTLANRESWKMTPEWQPLGYHGAYTNIAIRTVNFFNTNDFNLNLWIADQYIKPSSPYSYDGTNCWSGSPPRWVNDPQEARAMIARSRTFAIGEQGPWTGQTNQGVIQSAVNLGSQFGIGDSMAEHSAFFTRPIQTIGPFYVRVLDVIAP